MTYEGYTGDPEAWFAETERLKGSTDLETARPEPMSAYEGHSHEELYRMIHDDNDPGQLGDMAGAWTKLANIMATFGDRLTETVNESHAVWRGEAADAARTFTSRLATWSDQTGAGAQLVAHQTLYHSSAAQASRDEMPEPVPSPKMPDVFNAGHAPEQQEAAMVRAYQQAEAAERARLRAVEVMNNYDVQIRPTNRPSFPPPPSLGDGGDQDVKSSSGAGTTGPSGTSAPAPGVNVPGGHTGTTPGGATPGGTTPGGLAPGRPPVLDTPGGPGSSGLPPARPTRPGGTQAASAGAVDVGTGSGGRGGTGGVDSPGSGRGGPGGLHGDRNGILGRGGLDGAAAGIREAGAGQAGRGGPAGVPGAAGRRQAGEDDEEHKSKYLDHWDNGEVWFNDMPMTAPEVIGKNFEPPRAAPKAPPRRSEPTP